MSSLAFARAIALRNSDIISCFRSDAEGVEDDLRKSNMAVRTEKARMQSEIKISFRNLWLSNLDHPVMSQKNQNPLYIVPIL